MPERTLADLVRMTLPNVCGNCEKSLERCSVVEVAHPDDPQHQARAVVACAHCQETSSIDLQRDRVERWLADSEPKDRFVFTWMSSGKVVNRRPEPDRLRDEKSLQCSFCDRPASVVGGLHVGVSGSICGGCATNMLTAIERNRQWQRAMDNPGGPEWKELDPGLRRVSEQHLSRINELTDEEKEARAREAEEGRARADPIACSLCGHSDERAPDIMVFGTRGLSICGNCADAYAGEIVPIKQELRNLDFSEGVSSDHIPVHWNRDGAPATVGFETDGGPDGQACGLISRDPPVPVPYCALYQSVPAESLRGRLVRWSGQLRADQVSGAGCGISLLAWGKDGIVSAGPMDAIEGTTEWLGQASEMVVPDEAVMVTAGFYIAATGSVRAAAFRFETLDTP
ncbi:MAG: hypothetical protein ABR598_06445 [Candidatus Dormibacteria bacterium]